jgi:AcrR family transcriptional regulator
MSMGLNMTQVKTSRRKYDGSGRRQRAEHARERILAEALRLFLAKGYAGTTMPSIAAAAAVSVETVYKAYRSKVGILRELHARALAGSGTVHAERRSDDMRAQTPSAELIIENWARLQIEVSPLVVPVLLLIRAAAASTTDARELRDALNADRHARMRHHAVFLAEAGYLRPGLTTEHAADVMYAYTAPELYEMLVLQQGWALDEYRGFMARSLRAGLLP